MAGEPIPGEARDGSVEVAGWEDPVTGEWLNCEAGDRQPDPGELEESTRIVVSWTDADGETHHRTTSHITEDFSIADWLASSYGVEFV